MLRLFRRPPRERFEPDTEDTARTASAEDAEAEGQFGVPAGRGRRVKSILALGIVVVGLGALYFSWTGGRRDEPMPPRLLPQGDSSVVPEGRAAQVTPPVASSPASTPPAPAAVSPRPQPPTFYLPLERAQHEAAQLSASQAGGVSATGPYDVLAQASHEATVENLRAQIAELKLKTLKAELESDLLRKNPRRLFKEDPSAADAKKEPSPLDRLARVPPPMLAIPGPISPERQALGPAPQLAAPPAPPQMRVRMVTVQPKEALIEAGDGDSRGWFKAREGQKFPDFVVTAIGEDGITISFAGRGFFYPVGGHALGVSQENRPAGSRQTSEPVRH